MSNNRKNGFDCWLFLSKLTWLFRLFTRVKFFWSILNRNRLEYKKSGFVSSLICIHISLYFCMTRIKLSSAYLSTRVSSLLLIFTRLSAPNSLKKINFRLYLHGSLRYFRALINLLIFSEVAFSHFVFSCDTLLEKWSDISFVEVSITNNVAFMWFDFITDSANLQAFVSISCKIHQV